MSIRKIFRWLWYWAVGLLIGCAKFAAWCVIVAASLPFGFVLAAQLTRLNQSGDWRSVSFSDFLQILRIDIAPTGSGGIQTGIDFLLDLPATLVLFVAAIASFGIKKSLDAVKTRHSRRGSPADQGDMISSIERALANARKQES
jgi:hypothetical protein